MKIVTKFQPKIVIFTAVKNRCILHGCVFVINPYVTIGLSHPYHFDEGTFIVWGIREETFLFITKTSLCNILQLFTVVKMIIFR